MSQELHTARLLQPHVLVGYWWQITRLCPDPSGITATYTPYVSHEAQEVEPLLLVASAPRPFGKAHQPSFLLVELEVILGQALAQSVLDAPGILLIPTADDHIIRLPK